MNFQSINRFFARFVRLYLLATVFPFPFDGLPLGVTTSAWYHEIWAHAFNWLDDRFGYVSPQPHSGTGDSFVGYFQIFVLMFMAFVLALVWRNSDRWSRYFDIYLRWYLAATLFCYGFVKVIPAQFPELDFARLSEPFGEASPMGLLWAFMGYSRAYTIFGGAIEVIAGFLLLMPRLATVGAATSFAVMLNVFLLNICYDVPVKILSFHLVLTSLFLLANDGNRLIRFALGLSVPAIVPRFRNSLRIQWAQIVFAIIFTCGMFLRTRSDVNEWEQFVRNTPFKGAWKIDATKLGWREMFSEIYGQMTIVSTAGHFFRYHFDKQSDGTFKLQPWDRSNSALTFNIVQPSTDELILDGNVDGNQVHFKAHRESPPEFPLMKEGIHWVSEASNNH